ncbi:RTA1 like protein family [Stachybotrys elegans]|uniref:RTA1 like protein family n=1 Tax=Stachybotrys elegans TaxID=80388 RepID=A0A8K0WS47_9HYPO|nr:RTA1 like protein family [Stachybotrys elegans]
MSFQPDFTNHTWLDSAAAQLFCLDDPDYPGCENVENRYEYRINLAANIAFLAIFGTSLLGYLGVYAWARIGTGFTVALSLGVLCEILGYAGRTMSYYNQWEDIGFYIQICCLTFGPAFMAAGIYLCLRRIVVAFGRENSRIPPEYYTRIFIPCDLIALVLQALGGALAASDDDPQIGTNIMIAGLGFQVATGAGFIIAASDFAIRAFRRYRALGSTAFDQSTDLVHMRSSLPFRGFIGALALASLCILVRSCFRVAELSEGWRGPLMGRQDFFIGFEGVLIVVACLVLNVFHPAICMRPVLVGGGGLKGFSFLRKRTAEKDLIKMSNRNGSEST